MKYVTLLLVLLLARAPFAQKQEVVWSEQEKPIAEQISKLRSLPDDVRATQTHDLALKIRALPSAANKLSLAMRLSSRATEGDFGHDTLQEVATTLQNAIKEQNPPKQDPYLELASLARYEHINVSLDSPQFSVAIKALENEDRQREAVNFTLTDLNGKLWTLKDLKGKVVMVNIWATWCPPCRKEMPDLEALYARFSSQGFVILGISDDDPAKVREFIQKQGTTYPILLDPESKVNKALLIRGIPKTFVYDREGKIVAQSIDMRTRRQFLEMLAVAGLR